MAEEATSVATPGADVSREGTTAAQESSIQEALDNTFGGVDEAEREPADAGADSKGDDDGETVTVKEHKRRKRPRDRKEKQPQARRPKPSAWSDEDDANRQALEGGDDDLDDDDGDEPTSGQQDDSQQAANPRGDGKDSTPGEPVIEDRLLQAARRRGWSEDRIQRLVKADPELAIDTFEQLFEDANSLTREFSTLGKALHQQGQLPPQSDVQDPNSGQLYGAGQQPPPQQPAPQAQPQGQGQGQGSLLPGFQFKPEVLEGLDEPFVNQVLQPVQQYLDQIGQVMNRVVAGHDSFINERQKEMLYQQIDGFFNDRGESYQDLYGQGGRSEISPEALEARKRVVREADAIKAGAQMQGRNLTVAEALEMAHNLVSSSHQNQTARRQITRDIQKRQAQVTIPPTNRSNQSDDTSGDPIAVAEKNLNKRLKKINSGR